MQLPKLKIYSEDQLAPLIKEGSASFVNQTSWVEAFLQGVSTQVKRNPLSYRSYGPFWWPLKKLMQDRDLIGGEPVDADEVARISLGDAAHDVAAAFAFQENAHANLTAGNTTFTVDTEDGDTIDYVLGDDDMEGI